MYAYRKAASHLFVQGRFRYQGPGQVSVWMAAACTSQQQIYLTPVCPGALPVSRAWAGKCLDGGCMYQPVVDIFNFSYWFTVHLCTTKAVFTKIYRSLDSIIYTVHCTYIVQCTMYSEYPKKQATLQNINILECAHIIIIRLHLAFKFLKAKCIYSFKAYVLTSCVHQEFLFS